MLPRLAEVINKAASLREPHDAYLIVRDSSLTKVNHLYRTLSLSRPEVREFATAVDNLVGRGFLESILGYPAGTLSNDEEAKARIHLPIRLGGGLLIGTTRLR